VPGDEVTIDGYNLINCIATGNATQVWEVAKPGSVNRSAMKLMLKEAFEEKAFVAVLKHEAKVGKQLDHPNIVRTEEVVVTKKYAYIILEYFRALNLKMQIGTDITGLHVRIRKLVEQLCMALEYMHELGWLHKDIKPENILFNRSSELKLIDFSLSGKYSKGIGKAFSGKLKVIQGTRTYLAPELLLKKQPTPQTDMYSLGITLFEILTGHPPFRASSPAHLLAKHLKERPMAPSEVNTNVTPEMDAFVLKMLTKKPKDRHATMSEIQAEFRNIKVFTHDPAEIAKAEKAEAEKRQKQSLDETQRLDSRSDAMRQEMRANDPGAAPAKPAKPKPGRPVAGQSREAAEAPDATPPQPVQHQPDPNQPSAPTAPQQPGYAQPYPQQPYAQPFPQQPYAGQPYPQQMPPQQQYPQQGHPQQMPPQQQYPQQQYPQQQFPQQQYPQQQYPQPPHPQQGVPPQFQQPAQAPPQSQPLGQPVASPQPIDQSAPSPASATQHPTAGEQPAAANQTQAEQSGAPPAPEPESVAKPPAESKPATSPDDLPMMDELPPVD